MAGLIVSQGRDTGRCIYGGFSNSISLGRSPECDFQLHDPAVSRVHCHLQTIDGTTLLRDADSRWGTFVNGLQVEERMLAIGDRVLVGETELLVTHSDTEANRSTVFPLGRNHTATRTTNHVAKSQTASEDALRDDEQVLALLGNSYLNYELIRLIATSATGATFEALDTVSNQVVALKIFWPQLLIRPNERTRFVRAMKSAIEVNHPKVVRVLNAGRHRGTCFTASELVIGESVSALIGRIGICGMLDWRRVLRIGIDAAEALTAAHAHGLLHRNITPRNLLIRTQDDTVKLNDLVIAKAVNSTHGEKLTIAGELLGDLLYMSPEQLTSERPLDARSDIYSLGASLYAMLTGRPPLEGRNRNETMQWIEVEKPQPPTTHHLSVSPLFEGAVMRMLEKRPDDRHPSAAELLREFQRVAQYENVSV
ncbi:Serine/threonine-protein kinase PknB [Rubripirellula amarantea]|uniref:Serine/threonine-protein kinase PknB n=1 Tax=Rubripirellula amarantea TaxID=2527999 RepID=A0A5C5WK16_9BACT|nr:FHA domain-containing serine/threonine-protein kinase [Rubripirellula amarantea]TWT50445.1 Serine/threonine-protein kinase PknB [Rubripirellula amarantea]